jgi:predicted dehydrogenase
VPALAASQRCELVAIASRERDTAAAAAKQWNVPKAVLGYDALLADPEVDVVYVPLPNSLHAEWSVRAARAGKHVLCEKPLALSIEEVDRVAEAARANGVVVAEAFMYRHHPQTQRVVEIVRSGALGRPQLVRGAFTFTLSRPNDVRLLPALGGGCLWDVGCYPVGYARLVLGEEPSEAVGWQVAAASGIDEAFVGQLRFPSGALASFDSGFRSPFRTSIEVVGSEGVLHVPAPFKPGPGATITLVRGDRSETLAMPDELLYLGEVEDMADAVLLGRAPRISLEDSRGNCAALLALYRSAAEAHPVPLRP